MAEMGDSTKATSEETAIVPKKKVVSPVWDHFRHRVDRARMCRCPPKTKHPSWNCSTKLRNTIELLEDGVKSLTQ